MKRILSQKDLIGLVPYSATHIYRLERSGKFPRRIKLGPGRGGKVGWLEEEVAAWINERMEVRILPPC